MHWSDPYRVLGLARHAEKAEVKRAFREKALLTHPDLNTAPDAAQQYDRVRRAAEAILNGTEYQPVELRGAAAAGSRTWPRFDRMSRSPRFPMYFSAACLLGGCIIFAGALHAHNAVFDGYSYQVLEEAERRRVNPTPGQQKIMSLLMEKQDETAFQNNRSQHL